MTDSVQEKRYLPTSVDCFVCGEENQAGLQGRFYVEDGTVKLPILLAPHHSGYPDRAHGGVVAAAIDECMGWAASRALKRMCVTGEMTLRYLLPVPLDCALIACARAVKSHRRMSRVESWIEDEEGEIYVRGKGRYLPLSVEETLAVDDGLRYSGGEERVFDHLRSED